MESSILISTKKVLGLAADYTAFDEDVLMHINATFNILNQLGLCPTGFTIEDESAIWEDLLMPADRLSLTKTYIFLSVKLLFDPPATSYLITAAQEQLAEYSWRLNIMREGEEWTTPV